MQHRYSLRATTALLLGGAALLVACQSEPLSVDNTNQPDVERAYSTPSGVETIVSKLFQQMYNGQYGSADDIWTQTLTMSLESHSQLGNFGMGTRAAIPRAPIDNSIGNTQNPGNFRDFDFLSRNTRSATNALAAIDKYLEAGFSVGGAARDARAKAFAWFNLGYGMGQLSMLYDSVAILSPDFPTDSLPSFSPAAEANTAALAALDSAITWAGRATGQTIPADWISDPGSAAISMTRFTQIVRSFKARYRAGIGRTPQERGAADWAQIVADATNGITSDFVVQVNATTGWSGAVMTQLRTGSTWSQMTPFILGMADTSGAYKAWLAQPLTQRTPFLLRTPDKRFPAGETRAAQTTASGGSSKSGPPAGSILYFRNRPTGEDTPAEPWGTWYYDNHRFWAIGAGGGNGPFVVLSAAENDMLAAEGHLRANNFSAARSRASRVSLEGLGIVLRACVAIRGVSLFGRVLAILSHVDENIKHV